MARPRILMVEDDVTIATVVEYTLGRAGYEVLREADGKAGLETALRCAIDLAIVDLMLPELDGVALCRALSQRKPDVPLIILTARTEKRAMLEGFGAGADDFMTKPFDIDELLARVAARLRRGIAASADTDAPIAESVPGLAIDSDTHTVAFGGRRAQLKPKEFELFSMLASAPGHLFTRQELVHGVWHQQYQSSSRTLDVHVRRLRAQLDEIDAPVEIASIRGVGYRLVAR